MSTGEKEIAVKLDVILSDHPYRMVISNARRKGYPYRRIEILKKEAGYQAARYTGQQVYHDNMNENQTGQYLLEYLNEFSQLNAWGKTAEYELKISKKGKVWLGQKRTDDVEEPELSHNRKKKYILEEGNVIPPLVDMGIFTPTGTVVKSMYDKYRQINRFVEIVDDVIREKKMTALSIIDFGCGKSYLTFILYYYLTEIRGIDVQMVGLDLKAEVIKNCNNTARKYGYHGLTFELGDIDGYQCDFPVDMVITLHACDTATDYALHHAVEWGASMIFSAPCCQHELNEQIKSDKLSIMTRYGVIKERFSALATDAIRGNLLAACGYSTQLLEFIDLSHTPKNILIRAVKKNNMSLAKRRLAYEEVQGLMEEFGFEPKLHKLLQKNLMKWFL